MMNARDKLKNDLMRALNWASIDSLANTPDHALVEKIIDAPSLRGYRDIDLAKAMRGAKTLGEIIEKQCRDVLDVTGLHHLINDDGDGHWDVVWMRLFEMRDELASLKESTIGRERLRGDKWRDRAQEMEVSRDAAINALDAAGYSKPRQVSTVEELDALPEGAVILSTRTGDSAQIDHEGYWYLWGGDTGLTSAEIDLPASVLYEPRP